MAKKSRSPVDLSRKKVKEFDINKAIKVSYKTGKIIYSKNRVLKYLRQNLFKMLIISKNCPSDFEDQLNYFNSLLQQKDRIHIHKYKGSSWDLGLALAKPYMISVIGINDPGDSDILSLKTKVK